MFFFNDTATTEIYTLSLHDAVPRSPRAPGRDSDRDARHRLCGVPREGSRRGAGGRMLGGGGARGGPPDPRRGRLGRAPECDTFLAARPGGRARVPRAARGLLRGSPGFVGSGRGRSGTALAAGHAGGTGARVRRRAREKRRPGGRGNGTPRRGRARAVARARPRAGRESTRLNSSHAHITY